MKYCLVPSSFCCPSVSIGVQLSAAEYQKAMKYCLVSSSFCFPSISAGVQLSAAEYQKAIKYCKYASSALQYEDSKTAIDNLTKALKLLTTGKDT